MKRHTINEEYVPGIHPGLLHSTRLAYPQFAAAERHFGRKHIENIEFEALMGNVI